MHLSCGVRLCVNKCLKVFFVAQRIMEQIDDLSVEKQIILYIVCIVLFFLIACPCFKVCVCVCVCV